ncbi:MAG: efflux transporter outer membrane subunit [Rhodocyclaceae bacterium]|nr:efflux transporter outer membrane subunit [Rhodocyclaceae bacterium]
MATDPMRLGRALLPAALLSLLAACATPGATPPRPVIDLPLAWPAQEGAEVPLDAHWWRLFEDPALDALVDEALAANGDLAIAAERIEQARLQAGIVDTDRYPSVSGGASSTRNRRSLEGSVQQPAGTPRIQNTHQIGIEASYELDLWGRYRAASEAARADLLATQWAREGIRLSLIANVIDSYHALRAADASKLALQRTLAGRDDALDLLARRVQAGTASEFDLNQTRAERVAVITQQAALDSDTAAVEARLATLLGRSPRAILQADIQRGRGIERLPLQVPAGLPSELLLRRPDLRLAEARLAAADARIVEARALLYPSISLTAAFGQESATLSKLLTSGANVINLGLGLTQPIWNAGRLQKNVALTESQRREQLLAYDQALRAAFGDVQTAVAAQGAATRILESERMRADILRDTARQAGLRFDAGLTSRLEVLDAERNLLQAELAAINAEAAQRTAVTSLVRALGGGWDAAATGN